MIRRYYLWLSPDFEEGYYNIVNVGGTWKGHGCRSSGISIAPMIDDTDAANVNRYTDRPGYGQQVINDHIATNCGPVGGGPEVWDPEWNVEGIGGAVMLMFHVYVIPIKALLAIADRNNTSSVYVLLHYDPAMNTEKTGTLPWTRQRWTHHEDGYTEWRWDTTSGRTWRTNTRVLYEHMFTEYIQTSPGVFYLSDVYRQVGDVFLIRWSRCGTRPMLYHFRTLVVEVPRGRARIPMMKDDVWTFESPVEYYETRIMLIEYALTAKSFEEWTTIARAVVDNYERNREIKMSYLTFNEEMAVWTAISLVRDSSEKATRAATSGSRVMQLMGLQLDEEFTRGVAKEISNILMSQAPTSVTAPTLCHPTAYLREINPIAKVPRKIPFTFSAVGQDGLVTQNILDARPTIKVTKLYTTGTVGEQLCKVLWGKPNNIPAILPLGEIAKGGSVLTQNGTGLLATEIEYMIQRMAAVFVVKSDADQKPRYYCGEYELDKRHIIVYLDLPNDAVYRVHYQGNIKLSRVMMLLEAEEENLENDHAWIARINGTARTYEQANEVNAQYQLRQTIEVEKLLNKDLSEHVREKLLHQLGHLTDYVPIRLVPGMTYSQIPIVPNNLYYPQYDGINMIPGSEYPAPHLFSNWGISDMRRLRDPA
jgi:hypothetical protein